MYTQKKSLQQGVGLIEVLVAIILLAMALLGAIALQFATAKEQRSSQFVSRSALLANEIAERMRTNRSAIDDATLSTPLYVTSETTYTTGLAATLANASAVDVCTPTAPCATASAAQTNDIAMWRQSVSSALPQGAAFLTLPTGGNNTLTRDIVLAWVEPVVDKDANGVPKLLTAAQSGCPAALQNGLPLGVRCYQQRFVL
jgi:type IV pilus assembly protein PilV